MPERFIGCVAMVCDTSVTVANCQIVVNYHLLI